MIALLQMRLRLWPHRGSSKIPERIAALFDFAPSMLYLPAAERVWRLHRGRRPEPQEAASSLSLGTAAGRRSGRKRMLGIRAPMAIPKRSQSALEAEFHPSLDEPRAQVKG